MSNNTQIAPETQPIQIINDDGTLRADSRIIAERLDIQHHKRLETIRKYSREFNQLGILSFKRGEIDGRGQPEKYALLNEDQAVFALTLSRNTPQVVQLKLDLTVAFKNARQSQVSQHKMLEHARVNKELMALFGIDGNMQTIALNNAMKKKFGVDLLESWGANGLESETQEQTLTPSDIAQRLDPNLNARKVNLLLIEAGLQSDHRDHKDRIYYELTEAGQKHGLYLDTGKKHKTDGTPVRQLKWYSSAIDVLKAHLENAFEMTGGVA